MSKTIKVSDRTHQGIEDIQRPRETKGEVVARLLDTYYKAGALLDAIEGSTRFRESQRAKLKEAAPAH